MPGETVRRVKPQDQRSTKGPEAGPLVRDLEDVINKGAKTMRAEVSDAERVVTDQTSRDVPRESKGMRDSAVVDASPVSEEEQIPRLYATSEEELKTLEEARRLGIPDEIVKLFYNDRKNRKDLKYTDLEMIGRGGMGKVYKAKHRPLDNNVALKIVQPPRGEKFKKRDQERAQREIKNLARLMHPNVVRIIEGDFDENGGFFSQELVEGYNIDSHESAVRDLPVADKLRIFRGIAKGIKACHDAGIIHRDIKPENVMVPKDETGEMKYDEAKILDLGASILEEKPSMFDKGLKTLGLRKRKGQPGTPIYMSPEQWESHDIDSSTDTFSLGLTFFEALAARPPYLLVDKAHHGEQAKPRELFPDDDFSQIPDELFELIEDMLAVNPEDRPSDQEVIDELEFILEKISS